MIFSQQLVSDLKKGEFEVKVKVDNYRLPIQFRLNSEGTKFILSFGFNRGLIDIVKSQFGGRKWDHENKVWTAPLNFRNLFRIDALRKDSNPYSMWDSDLNLQQVTDYYTKYRVEPYKHQIEMTALQYYHRWTLLAADMGLGKTLSTIMMLRMIQDIDNVPLSSDTVLWVSPKACIASSRREFAKWGLHFTPTMITYESLSRMLSEWPKGKAAPKVLICDESTKCKTPTANRTRAVQYFADNMRNEYGHECWITLLNGTPAPKMPTDYWSQVEICCPGFLAEGSIHSLRARLAVMSEHETETGSFRKVDAWVEDEVKRLGDRLKGLSGVWYKRDCLDLPEKRYEVRRCTPTKEIINLAQVIANTEIRAVDVLTGLRMLSDGFQYRKIKSDVKITCNGCNGSGTQMVPELDDDGVIVREVNEICAVCKGTMVVNKIERQTVHIGSPKDDLLREDLGVHEEVGRIVIFGGFQGTVDRIAEICQLEKWNIIRVDGRGWITDMGDFNEEELLEIFDNGHRKYPRVAFVGHPGAAGLGLNLTASPSVVFYSNTFSSLDRMQAEDRIYRIGMQERGGNIIDYVHLPTDLKVIDNLKAKKDLQELSMNAIMEGLQSGLSEQRQD